MGLEWLLFANSPLLLGYNMRHPSEIGQCSQIEVIITFLIIFGRHMKIFKIHYVSESPPSLSDHLGPN